MPLHIVSHPDYDAQFSADHRFPMGKYRALRERLTGNGLLAASKHHLAIPAPVEALKRAHDGIYVDQVLSCSVPTRIEREIGFPVTPLVSRRAHLATGGTMMASRLALEHGTACNAAGGSHHARRFHGAGFCTFNDVAVAALDLIAERPAMRILIVDLDVHQGDGTAEILGGHPQIFTFSMHCEKNYPVRKVPSTLDIGLPDCIGDEEYMDRLEGVLPRLSQAGPWEIAFYNAGVDPHVDDRLGRLSLTDEGLRARERAVIGHFRSRGVPLCGVIGGGYSRDIEALVRRHAILFEVASDFA